MAQFLSLSRRRVAEYGAEAFTPELVEAEGNRVREMYTTGKLRQIWRRGDTPGAAILWETESVEQVREAVASLPMFVKGMLELESVIELHPYGGFAPR